MKASQCKRSESSLPPTTGGSGFIPTSGRFSQLQRTQQEQNICVQKFIPLSTRKDLYYFRCEKRKISEFLLLWKRTRELLENNIQLNCFLKFLRITSLSKEQIYRAINSKYPRKNKEKTWLAVTSTLMTMAHSASGWRPSTLEIKVFAFIF